MNWGLLHANVTGIWGVFPFTCQYSPISLRRKQYFCILRMSITAVVIHNFPNILYIFLHFAQFTCDIYNTISTRIIFSMKHSLRKYYTCTPCFKENPFFTCTQYLLFMKQHKPDYPPHIAVLIRGTACRLSPLSKPALHLNTLRYKIIVILCVYVEIKCQLDAKDDFYCRSSCLLNMFRAPLCP